METQNNYDFGPEEVRLTNSIVFEKYLSEQNRSIPQDEAEIICRAIVQLQSAEKKTFILERLRGSSFDFWNLYVNGKNVFCLSEAKCGYTLRYFDDTDLDTWFDDFCELARRHSTEFGRNL